MEIIWIILALVIVVIGYAIVIYNQLVAKRQAVNEAWSGVDVQLKRRANLIPNMLEAVKGYVSHENETLAEVTKARAAVSDAAAQTPGERGPLEGILSGALGKLMAVVEDYPELKADSSFLEFQGALQQIEDEIQMSRRYYNGTVRDINVLVQSFPSNLVAQNFGFSLAEYFELTNEADRAVPKVAF